MPEMYGSRVFINIWCALLMEHCCLLHIQVALFGTQKRRKMHPC